MSISPEQNRMTEEEAYLEASKMKKQIQYGMAVSYDDAEKNLELDRFPEKFKQIYNFAGSGDARGFVGNFLSAFESTYLHAFSLQVQERRNLIKLFTNESVVSYIRNFFKYLREKFVVELATTEPERLLADRSGPIQVLLSTLDLKNQDESDELIAMIKKTGMDVDGAVFDMEKYLDVQEFCINRERQRKLKLLNGKI